MSRTIRAFFVLVCVVLAHATAAQADSWAACRSQDPSRAIDSCSAIISANPDKSEHLADHLADAYALRGIAHVANKDMARGLADLDKAISLKPNHAGAYLERGRAHEALGRYALAKQDFNQAARLFEALELGNPQPSDANTTTSLLTPGDAGEVVQPGAVTGDTPSSSAIPLPSAKPNTYERQRVRTRPATKTRPKATKSKRSSTKKKRAKTKKKSTHKKTASKSKPRKTKKTTKAKPDVRQKVTKQINCSIAGGFDC
ncbi:MAG: tetratricopeptide repeat protein [Pseudomonadota bacterium]